MLFDIILKELVDILKALNFEPTIDKDVRIKYDKPDTIVYDIHFNISITQSFSQRYKDMVRMLTKGYLYYFYYETGGTQHIYLTETCNGLKPNNSYYDHLITYICKTPEDQIKNNELFIITPATVNKYTNVTVNI